MLSDPLILGSALFYIGLLFAVAYWGDRAAEAGRSVIANPWTYTLSLGVYCTAWTFYGSAGRAAHGGIAFLPVYLGPTLVLVLGWQLVRRIVRISQRNRITSIADLIGSRYGKSHLLAGLVTVIAVIGIMPYISIQLKAIATSYTVLRGYPEVSPLVRVAEQPVWADTTLYAALALIAFAVLFGTRHIDNTERHEGLVAAIAFESVVKLGAFLLVGAYVVWSLNDGFGDIFTRAAAHPELAKLMRFDAIGGGYAGWVTLTLLSACAFLFLPRQFQVLVVENTDEHHLRTASWAFPLYLWLINLFVLPVALAGLMTFESRGLDADLFVLDLPIHGREPFLAVLVFVGGLSAATSMVIVETVALSTMVCNDLVMPLLLRRLRPGGRRDLSGLLLGIRRIAIAGIVLLGYLYYRVIGESYTLVSIGLVSFAACAQFAPVILAGIYWKGATRRGAYWALSAGFAVWAYTLLLPSFARSGWLPEGFVTDGPFGIELLKPYALFGLAGLDQYSHALVWSWLANVGGLLLGSLWDRPGALERVQASQFVDAWDSSSTARLLWRGTADIHELQTLVARFLGPERAASAFAGYAQSRGLEPGRHGRAEAELVHFAERLLAGAIGAASARVTVSSVVKGEALSIEEVMTILDETSQAIQYSRRLEEQSRELEAAGRELRAANARLQELDRLKDEFVSTVTHELRTPLTSIRAFAEILLGAPDIPDTQRAEFLGIIVKESERLSRLINQVLDMAKLDSGRVDWRSEPVELRALLRDAANATSQLFRDKGAELTLDLDEAPAAGADTADGSLAGAHALHLAQQPAVITGDSDRLQQVLINLLSNAVKFCPEVHGRVAVRLRVRENGVRIEVADNGPGIPLAEQARIFEKFHQVSSQQAGKPKGTGLGLTISQRIVERHGGTIRVESIEGEGACFIVELPAQVLANAAA
ncbi:MAG TPA: sensor histidine kinase [Plasticicumulans sp.]|nr:sensor histidine kinase [Plasticicumulans sp.]